MVTRDINGYDSVASVVEDDNLRAILGHGDNVDASINGVPATMNTAVRDGDTINLVTRANAKA